MSAVLLVLACSGEPQPRQTSDSSPREVQPLPAHAALGPVTGSHGGTITTLAVSRDGTAVVSADEHGGVRLWPALDGTREPIAIASPAPKQLAIARRQIYESVGSGASPRDVFAIAVQDAADQLHLIEVSTSGEIRSRVALGGGATQVDFVAGRLLVVRADHTIDVHDGGGAALGRLVPEPGLQIASVAVRGDRALVLLAKGEEVRGRWINFAGAPSWGASTKLVWMATDHVVLGADGRSIIGLHPKTGRAKVFDLMTGRMGRSACGEPSSQGGGRFVEPDPGPPLPIAVLSSGRVACLEGGAIARFDIAATESHAIEGLDVDAVAAVAAADDLVIGALGHQLVIIDGKRERYLGYGFRELTHVRVSHAGVTIGKGDQQPLLLDDALHERARLRLPPATANWTDVLPIDERYAITASERGAGGDSWGPAYAVALFDSTKQSTLQILPHRAHSGLVAYEPATQLLASSDYETSLLVRYDAAAHRFDSTAIGVELGFFATEIALVDPALAGGLVGLAVRDDHDGVHVAELHGGDLSSRSGSIQPRRVLRIPGDLRAVDRAGRVYIHADGSDVAVYANGEHVAQLRGITRLAVRPSPDAKTIAAFGDGRLVAFASDGTLLWETAAWDAKDLGWTPSGELFARFTGALAKVDLATGMLRERQCGWAFALASAPHETIATSPSVCDVAP